MASSYAFARDTTEGFAQRVRNNLDYIIESHKREVNVHEVTQLTISLLGLIVFPWEAGALKMIESTPLIELESKGWPHWTISLDGKHPTDTLGKLTKHLRNAAAHRRLKFSSDERDMKNVDITFEDAPKKGSDPTWRATINAADLKVFCDRFTKSLEDLVS